MAGQIDEWPWNRAWPWLLLTAPVVLFTGWLWIPIGSCAGYTDDYRGDTSCYVGPAAGYAATWVMTGLALVLVLCFGAGLLRALVRRGRRGLP
ncbi:hypothetical protein SAMN04489743_2265 [Pseudarthrobacter equi]|uniref:Uncharacterized protein n=1 Tax=Pseudarthrobacter equi TaxID=728066 RepID=A0A1H1Z2V8_9MICC|nr:hypothetical protein [Pseudarthrobacter equi]SDT27947.1 hypothetical protein SAMN04489743_2265 [Pseudarthrobacter equi]